MGQDEIANETTLTLTPRRAALAAQTREDALEAFDGAMETHRTLRLAIADLERAQATVAQARANHNAACARLRPALELARQVAA